MRKLFKLATSCILATIMICSVIQMTGITVSAAEYKGKGTKTAPYIVETAEQLDGMRNNLTAHYMLGNTIDMSGVANFKPIGNLAKPFKGSFSCDLDSSGKPKYAIKNLKITVAPAGATRADKWSGYKENGTSGWEAGLFGSAKNATFKNILILDATVDNKVEGYWKQNPDYSINPGVDDQATGILLAIGESVTVTGCGVSGTVTSSSNQTGGMIGLLKGGKVSKCYSYANVTCTGAWHSGGLIANLGNGTTTTVSTSFYSGTFSGSSTHAGAFIGGAYETKNATGVVTDCWAEGTVKTEETGCFLGTKNHADGTTRTSADVSKNCYTLAKIEGRKNAQSNRNVKNNNYITNEPGGLEMGFAAASQAEMNAAFKGLSNWTVADGTYPQIKGLVATKDASAYVVQEITASTGNETSEGTGEDVNANGKGDTEDAKDVNTTDTVEVRVTDDESLMKVSVTELILIVLLCLLIILTVIGSVITMFLIIRKMKSQNSENERKVEM